MTMADFYQHFIEEPAWFDHTNRPKTYNALKALCERVPGEIIEQWPAIVVFAPSPDYYGQCLI